MINMAAITLEVNLSYYLREQLRDHNSRELPTNKLRSKTYLSFKYMIELHQFIKDLSQASAVYFL